MAAKKKEQKRIELPETTVIKRADLSKSLTIAGKAVNPKIALPLLTNVLIECNNGNSSVTATNLEILVRSVFSAEGVPFSTCIPASTFKELVDSINTNELEIKLEVENQNIIISTDNSTSSIKCISPEEFPNVPQIDEPQISMPVALFKNMVNRVAFAASTDDNRGALVGVQLSIEDTEDGGDKKFIMFAADGNRASYEETTGAIIQGEVGLQSIIKGATLETIAAILPDEGMMDIEILPHKVLFHCDEIDIASQAIDGNFPNHRLVYASVSQRDTSVKVNTLELLRACKQLKVFAKESGATKMEIQDMLFRFSTMKHERGESNIMIFVEKEGMDVEVGINAFFLYEFLEVVKTENVIISFAGPKKPILLTMEGEAELYHVIMPLYL